MTEQDNGTSNNQDSGRKAFVRGKFPRLSLTKALDLPKAVLAVGQGEPARRLRAFDYLGGSPEGGASRTLITASSTAYGLTKGGAQATHLELTDRGRRIVSPASARDRLEAAYEALFGNDIFAAFIDYWEDKNIPKDDVASDWLVRNHGVLEKDAGPLWEVMKANINDFGLTQSVSGRTLVASRETALQNVEDADVEEGTPHEVPSPEAVENSNGHKEDPNGRKVPTPREVADLTVGGGSITPQIHFNIQIQLPENGSPDDYDAIFRSIGTYLLGRKDD